MGRYGLAGLFAAVALACPALADEADIELKDGTGRETVEANCGACHSLDYIVMNAPFLDRPKWEATVKKMVGPFGAAIAEQDIAVIVDYLAANYGP
ncbi:MAG: cytochrome c [Alphaproteobacteria bacterium]